MPTRLTGASKRAKEAAAAVASKVAKNPSQSKAQGSTPATNATAITAKQGDIAVPGLMEFTPDQISGQLPQFEDSKYLVSDPLNPSESIPQVSQQQYDKSEAIYQGGIRALKLTGMSFDMSKERFTTLRKKVSAFGSGVKLATEVEKVRGDFLDYLNQGETNKQKNIALGVAVHKTATDTQKAVFDMQSMDEKLEQSRVAADLATLQTQEKLSGLTEFQKQLNGQV